MFSFKMADAKFFKSLLVAVSTLLDEACFNADEKSLRLRSMDPSHVAMVDFECPKEIFDDYICDAPTKLCLNIKEMLTLLRRIGDGESIEIINDPKLPRLKMVLKSTHTRTFNISTIESAAEESKTPNISFNAVAKIEAESIKNAIDDASLVSDQVKFEMDEKKIMISSSGDVGDACIEIEKGSEDLLKLEVKEHSISTFSLNYLSQIIKAASSISEIVTIELSTGMPIKLDFELPKNGKLQYYLAPRIEPQ